MVTSKLELVAVCSFRPEEQPPGEIIACPQCACPVTPGLEHPPHDGSCILDLFDGEDEP